MTHSIDDVALDQLEVIASESKRFKTMGFVEEAAALDEAVVALYGILAALLDAAGGDDDIEVDVSLPETLLRKLGE